MTQDRKPINFKSWIFTSRRKSPGRPICAVIGITAAAVLYRLGYSGAEPTMMTGIAFAALGAIAGLVVYGLYDVARKLL